MNVLIYAPGQIERNAGGPAGYLWHLKQGLQNLAIADNITLLGAPEVMPSSLFRRQIGNFFHSIEKIFKGHEFGWRLVKTHGPTGIAKICRDILSAPLSSYFLPESIERAISGNIWDALHVHTTIDAVRANNSLIRLGLRDNVRLMLTSHCPEIPAVEKSNWLLDSGISRSVAKQVESKLRELDLASFALVDQLIFPCQEAMEPYLQDSKRVHGAISQAETHFILTGIVDPKSDIVADDRRLDGLPKTTFSFVGRHNHVKGYDILAEGGIKFLDSHDQAAILVAGSEGPVASPKHPRWKEFGWIDWSEALISSSRAFILPNRQTYFDLVALEVMALGVPLIASNTGGNKALGRLSPGVFLFEPLASSLAEILHFFTTLPDDVVRQSGEENRSAFVKHFTAQRFAESYVDLMRDLVSRTS